MFAVLPEFELFTVLGLTGPAEEPDPVWLLLMEPLALPLLLLPPVVVVTAAVDVDDADELFDELLFTLRCLVTLLLLDDGTAGA